MVSGIFEALTEIAQAFVSFLTGLFENIVGLIWVAPVDTTPGHLTVLGTLLLIGLATGLVMWAFYFIRSLIRVRRG